MSYMSDPERKRIALEKRAQTRAELGPRLGYAAKGRPRPTAPSKAGGPRRIGALGNQHPTRDSRDD